jgi:protein SCO1/2
MAPVFARWVLTLVALFGAAAAAPAQDSRMPKKVDPEPTRNPNVDFEQKLGEQVPLDLTFRAAGDRKLGPDGKPTPRPEFEPDRPVTLADCFGGKPTVLVMAYYRCPMLCNQVIGGLLEALRVVGPYSAGKDFSVVVVSFDPKEANEYQLAARNRDRFLHEYGRPGAEAGVHFLTGSKESIAALASAVGFRYEFDKQFKEYNHASGIMVVTPGGKLSRYFYGIDYLDKTADGGPKVPASAQTLRLTLVEAGEGKIGAPADKLLLFCYRFDHLSKGYSLRVMRVVQVAGAATVLLIAGGFVFLSRRYRTKPAAVAAATDLTTPAGVAR